jgi:hypothetical protein
VNRHAQKYTRNVLLAFAGYAVLVIVSVWWLGQNPDGALRFLIAVLPMLPLIFGLRSFLRYLSTLDELQNRIQLQAIGFAAGATGMITLTYGFLENAGLPRLSMLWVFPLLCFLWGGASWLFTRRYQ